MPAQEAAEEQRPPPPVRSTQAPTPEALTAATKEFALEEGMMPVCWSDNETKLRGSRISSGGPEISWLLSIEVLSLLEPCDLDRLVPHTRQ